MEMYLEKVSNVYKDFINEVSLYINETMRINKKEIVQDSSDRQSMEILASYLNINNQLNYKHHGLFYRVEDPSGDLVVEVLPVNNSPFMLKNIGFIFDHALYENNNNEIISELKSTVNSISLKKIKSKNDITAEYIFTTEFNGVIARDPNGISGSNVFFSEERTYSNFIHEPENFKPINFLIFINSLANEDFELASKIAFSFNNLNEVNKESIHLLYDIDLNDTDLDFFSFDIDYFLKNEDIKSKKCYSKINKPI